MTSSLGDGAQTRMIAEQVAKAVLVEYVSEHPELREAKIPAPLKWAGAVIAGLFTLGTATLVFWLVSSVSQMQVTVARIDERLNSGSIKDARFEDMERRVTKNEAAIAELKR